MQPTEAVPQTYVSHIVNQIAWHVINKSVMCITQNLLTFHAKTYIHKTSLSSRQRLPK